jgi:pimeloyl-ACP methyl ester carboxylesterase
MVAEGLISRLRDVATTAGRQLQHVLHEHSDAAWPLPAAIEAERRQLQTADAGALSYYEDSSGEGRPLVLVHGVHAAASAYEMRFLFNEFRGERPVYALDLPGFGFSQRGGMRYTPDTYVHAIEHLLRDIADEREEDRADIVALSLSSEFAARVAAEMPELVHSLVMLSPTGFGSAEETNALARRARNGDSPALWKTLTGVGGELLYDLLVSRWSLSYYLRKSFAGRVDPNLLDYSYVTSHQPGAHVAPLAFISGELFPAGEPKEAYARVDAPALVVYGEDPNTGFGELRSFVQDNQNYQCTRVPHTRGLPQIEARERTIRALRAFWEQASEGPRVGSEYTHGGLYGSA